MSEIYDVLVKHGFLTFLTLLTFFAFFIPYSIAQAPPQNTCSDIFCLTDAFNTNGNMTIKICAGTEIQIRGFNVWYNGTGPFNLTGEHRITNATYINETIYDDVIGLNNMTGGGCVNLVLNGTEAPFTNETIEINATIYNKIDYASASNECVPQIGCNGTMFTINYVFIGGKDVEGNPLPNALFMTYNNYTKSFISQGPAAAGEDGYYAQHCVGIVSGVYCVNATPIHQANECRVHGIPFPSGMDGPSNNCYINSTTTIFSFDFVSSNTSSPQNVTPGTPLYVTLDHTSAVGFVTPFSYTSSPQPPEFLNLSNVRVMDYATGEVVYTANIPAGGDDQGPKGGPPFFIDANKIYNVTVNISGIGEFSYLFMPPSKGMTGLDIYLPNSSVTAYSTLVGKVVNESGSPIDNAIVYVQLYKQSSAFGISLYTSAITDANGRFAVTVPSTQMINDPYGQGAMPYPIYQFYIVSNKTTNNIPLYFPTLDNNNNRGYFAQGSTVVLSPLIIKAGGQVNINVGLNGSSLVLSELSKIISLGTGIFRSAVTGKFTMISIFPDITPPSSTVIQLLSPVSVGGQVFYNLIGKSQSFEGPESGAITGVCFNSTTILQGAVTSSVCSLQSPGYINLTVFDYDSIFNKSRGGHYERVSDFGFWFDTVFMLRNSTGDIVFYLNPEGMILQDILGFGGTDINLTIPVPPGTYTAELQPDSEFSRFMGARNTTSFTVNPNQTLNLEMTRAQPVDIQERFPNSLVLSSDNPLVISLMGEVNYSLVIFSMYGCPCPEGSKNCLMSPLGVNINTDIPVAFISIPDVLLNTVTFK